MTRLIISLEERDKDWLERTAGEMGVSMAEVARLAIEELRASQRKARAEQRKKILDATQGIWTEGDGLDYQTKIRKEWD